MDVKIMFLHGEEYIAIIEWVKEAILLKFIIGEVGITQVCVKIL